MKFTELDLKPGILAALKDMEYIDLTPVQEKTFPHILSGRDLIARAETGSGKTAACAIPLVQMVDTSLKAVQSLVLVPTRELALQYVSEISKIAKKSDVAPFAVYGGFSMQTQLAKLDHGVDILVATPGRLIDLLYNTPLSLSEVRTFVLDEADEMLNMGFIGDVELILSCLIHEHQTLLFSATMPKAIEMLARKFLKDPLTLYMTDKHKTPQSLLHHFLEAHPRHRTEALEKFLAKAKPKQCIIFCNSRSNAEKLYDHLKDRRKGVEIIHGGLEQPRRTSLFNRFKRMEITTMVATDLASRGLDFAHATHVINFDFPKNVDAYTHRTGRTARMGRKGTALSLYGRADLRGIKAIIDVNKIEPVWENGKAPDLNNLPKKKRPYKKFNKKRRSNRPPRRR